MSEMRWNPILREWVVTATHRQDRTFLPPADFCPLCPTREGGTPTEIPAEDFDFVVFENKFPSLLKDPPPPAVPSGDLLKVQPSLGVCEVVLYTPQHDATLTDLPTSRIEKLMRVWQDRYVELGRREEIKYVFIFENKGEAIGVTIPHPHGQIYAFSELPPKIERELKSESMHHARTGRCLHCDVIAEERRDGRRIIAESRGFVAVVPFYARYPYEVHIYSKEHIAAIDQFRAPELGDLSCLFHIVLKKYDNLWGLSMPYMMVMHQKPTDGLDYPGSHFHIEFYPPLRTADKLKYVAGCESGAGTFVNDTLPEETAEQLRKAAPARESEC